MVKTKSVLKTKKKVWIPIVAPAIFNNAHLGDSYVTESNLLVGRFTQENLMNLTRNLKNKNVAISFKISEIVDGVAHTVPMSYTINPSSIKRLVRTGTDKVDDAFKALTKDKKVVLIKPLMITVTKIKTAIETSLRMRARYYLKTELAKLTYIEFVREVVLFKIQKGLYENLRKVYPVKIADIRTFKLLEGEVLDEQIEGQTISTPGESIPVENVDARRGGGRRKREDSE